MSIVLGSQIMLTDSEKVQVVELLTKAYEKYPIYMMMVTISPLTQEVQVHR